LHTIGSKRLLSKKWIESPNLDDAQWYGGYYTQAEIKEILTYAHQHYIEVIPEIEMPGHATAPLVAYPEYSCTTPPKIVPTIGAGNRQAYCAGYAPTYTFLHDVLDEIVELFGTTKVHIGGDELPKERWEHCPRCQSFMKQHNIPNLDMLQVHFAADMINHLAKRNCKTFGWFDFPVDRLLDQKVDPDSVIFQFWVGSEKRVGEFVRKGGKAVISDNRFMYLDYTYSRISLKKAYTFDPIPADLEPQYHDQILGCEPPIWCERVPNWQRMDFQVFPRVCAYAETAWTLKEQKDYSDFVHRLKQFLKRLDLRGIYYAPLSIATNSFKGRLIPRNKLYS
jgi:hexosaminidase